MVSITNNLRLKLNSRNLAIVSYLFAIFVVYFLYSPNIAINAIKSSIQNKDVEILDNYVDFGSIHQSINEQIKTELIFRALSQKNQTNTSNQLLMIEVSRVIQMVEDFTGAILSKDGLNRVFQSSKVSKKRASLNYLENIKSKNFVGEDLSMGSFGEILLNGKSLNGRPFQMSFKFRYFRWVLTGINIDLSDITNREVVLFIRQFQQDAAVN